MSDLDFAAVEKKIRRIKKIYNVHSPQRKEAIRILEESKREEIKEILNYFSTNNPKIYVDINENIILFEDLVQLDRTVIQKICQKFSPSLVALALRLGDENLRTNFLQGVSSDDREIMEPIISGPPQKKSNVMAAIGQIMIYVRSLQEKGLIGIVGGANKGGTFV
ncbi:MAG: hypothetical protein OXB88_07960 [Bacteriovoracales bacterium]|nr:hypothetical protein [Bacteriovoracales bacterium]